MRNLAQQIEGITVCEGVNAAAKLLFAALQQNAVSPLQQIVRGIALHLPQNPHDDAHPKRLRVIAQMMQRTGLRIIAAAEDVICLPAEAGRDGG